MGIGRLVLCALLAAALQSLAAADAFAAAADAATATVEPPSTVAAPASLPAATPAAEAAGSSATPPPEAVVGEPPAAVVATTTAIPQPGSAATPPAPTSDDTTIYVNVGYFHSDLVLRRADLADAPPMVKAAVDRTKAGEWIIIGWGPWWFGRDVKGAPFRPPPLRMMVAAWTLVVPQMHSQLRVAAIDKPGPAPGEGNMAVKPIQISRANLQPLLQRINRSFVVGRDGGPISENRKGLADGVSVYRSAEIYHLTHLCNHWLGEVLHAGGFSTFYLMDLFPQTLVLDLSIGGAKGPARADAGKGDAGKADAAPAAAEPSPGVAATAAAAPTPVTTETPPP